MRNLVPSFLPLPHPSSSRPAFWGLLFPRGGRLGGGDSRLGPAPLCPGAEASSVSGSKSAMWGQGYRLCRRLRVGDVMGAS